MLYNAGVPGGSAVKNPPAMQEIWVQSLGWERSSGEGNGNLFQHSCLEIPCTGEPGELQDGVEKRVTQMRK